MLISALPFFELRGGIPLALYYGFDPAIAFIIAFIGNLLPVPFLLLFLEQLRNFTKRWRFTAGVYLKIEKRTESNRILIEKYGYAGLMLFVAIPFPITGAWTGSLLAFLLKLNVLKALFFIAIGIAIAGFIVTSTAIGLFSIALKL
jgi:uncharacterized membrane protein